MVSEFQGLKWAVVMIMEMEKGKGFDGNQNHLIRTRDCRFEPRVSIFNDRYPISVMNTDKIPHRGKFSLVDSLNRVKHITAMALPWDKKQIEVSRICKHIGLVSISGIIHPFEKAWIWRTSHPYIAVTDENGKFKISDIPEGRYKIRVWHELLGEQFLIIKVSSSERTLLKIVYNN